MIGKAQTGADWVLVVDDDSVNLHIANRILASGGIRASCVRSGEMALRMLRSEGKVPDLVLLDLHMSGMDGFETLSAMRENPASAAIPVIFLTAEEDSEAEARAGRGRAGFHPQALRSQGSAYARPPHDRADPAAKRP